MRIAGLTLYGGPDGSGGSSSGQEFTFSLDQWDQPNGVWVQGLGDNQPGDSGNLDAAFASNDVFLRMEVTELPGAEHFQFMYKANPGDSWSLLGSLNANFNDARVALFLKGYSDASYQDVTFKYFDVGGSNVPDTGSTLALAGLGLLSVAAFRRRKS